MIWTYSEDPNINVGWAISVLSLPVLAKNWQWWAIPIGFLKSGSDEADSDIQFCSSDAFIKMAGLVGLDHVYCSGGSKKNIMLLQTLYM